MRHLTIAISHPSPVVASGLAKLASRIRDCSVSVCEGEADSLRRFADERGASIVICDPLTIDRGTLDALRSEEPRPVIVAMTLTQLPPSIAEEYDFILGVYDPPSRLEEIVSQSMSLVENTSEEQPTLSPREKEVVIGVVKGLSNKEIAAEMCVSTNTVMTHRRNIATKLQIHSAAGLTIYAIINKLVKLEELHNL